jgi:phenylacetic acid degradation operon negative regulatory protein
MQARSALFDLYGDYLGSRGGQAQVAALVRLLAPLGIAAPAVRTAVSRMVGQGWLEPVRLHGSPGYRLTGKAARRLDEAARRIYRTAELPWSGRFDLVVLTPPTSRAARGRLSAHLAFLGYGRLDQATWVAPRPGPEIDTVLAEASVRFDRFTASHAGSADGAKALVRRAWDLAALAEAYRRFLAEFGPVILAVADHNGPAQAYAARFRLVHAWRTFLFSDPQLPASLLPQHWPGHAAAAFFDQHEARLRPAADQFVEACLDQTGGQSEDD